MHFSVPEQNIKALHLTEGMKVADFGAGSGAYAFSAAHRVGVSGHVYAIDVQKELLVRLKRHAEEKHLRNIEIVHGDLDRLHGSKLRDMSVDAVIIANILFQSEHASNLLAEAYRIVKPGSQMLLVDWSESYGHLGPPPGHVVKESEARGYAESAGFEYGRRVDAGAHHYGIIFKKP